MLDQHLAGHIAAESSSKGLIGRSLDYLTARVSGSESSAESSGSPEGSDNDSSEHSGS